MTDGQTRDATQGKPSEGPPATRGRVLHSARTYDLLAWVFLFGREQAFRQRVLNLAGLTSGESMLDVGCGTGTLAIHAKRQTGPTGNVQGVDASAEMIARAQRKARRATVDVTFQSAVVEALPFPDGTFDVVSSTLMLHHLPRATREQCAREMGRVLKKGGRVVTVDFGVPQRKRSLLPRLHRHGGIAPAEMIRVLGAAGLRVTQSGALGLKDMHFAIASSP